MCDFCIGWVLEESESISGWRECAARISPHSGGLHRPWWQTSSPAGTAAGLAAGAVLLQENLAGKDVSNEASTHVNRGMATLSTRWKNRKREF